MKDDLRQEVLMAARSLFMQKGFDAVGMREIAQAVGRQPTQVYRLKLSKIDILAEIIVALNDEQIRRLPAMLARIKGATALERTCKYLEKLYRSDIEHLPLRQLGAAYGWTWSGKYEAIIVPQVLQLLAPIAKWMAAEALEEIPARCYSVWSLYYVGYRRAVMQGGTASECLAEIRPSLALAFIPNACSGDTHEK
jgi:AcrR family transcriptional regulator